MHVNADNYQKEEDTPAWKIFNNLIAVSVPSMFLYSTDYLKHHGIISTNIEEAKNELKSYREVKITVNELIELRREGAPVNFLNEKSVQYTFEVLRDHMSDWYEIISSGRYIQHPPIDDFMIMDEILNDIYPSYALILVRNLNSGTLSDGNIPGKSFFSFGKKKKYTLEDIGKYESYLSAIINLIGKRNGNNEFFNQI